MIIKSWLLSALLLMIPTAAFAACPSPLTGKDAGGVTQNLAVVVDASGNCTGTVVIGDGTTPLTHANVTAWGVAPTNGIGVNADIVAGSVGITGTLPAFSSPPPVAQSGTWTVGLTANTAGTPWFVSPGTGATFPVSGTFWQTTQPVSAASLPLPSGAATSTNQPTAATLGSTTSGQSGGLSMGAVTTSPPSYTNAQTDPLSLDVAGNLRVNCITGCSSSTSITGWGGGTLGAMANYGTSPGAVLVPGFNAFVTNTNANGAAAPANSSPVTLPADQTLTATAGSSSITAADAATTSASWSNSQSAVTGTPTAASFATYALTPGTQSIGVQVTGTHSLTLQTEVSMDGGTTYFAVPIFQDGIIGGHSTFSGAGVTGNFAGYANVARATHFRVRATAFTSGTATIAVQASDWSGVAAALPQLPNTPTLVANNATIANSASLANTPAVGFNYVSNGSNWIQMAGDGSGNVKVVGNGASGQVTMQGLGTAGAASGNILTVQGVASMTPLAVNQTQVNGTALSVTNPGFTEITDGIHAAAATKAASTAAVAADPALVVALSPAGDPCLGSAKSGGVINLTASGQVITGTASKKTYICALNLVSATAQNIALVEGTGTTCATNIFGLAGGTTAATGWNLAANGGHNEGSGVGTVISPSADTNATAANVCLLLSGTGQTSGQVAYVQQ